jgi:coenzyme PQQ precursor peptide PqqA
LGISTDRTGEELDMTWETPTAIDFRFGFEITMYVAAR